MRWRPGLVVLVLAPFAAGAEPSVLPAGQVHGECKRLTNQIATIIMNKLDALGVAVVIEAEHLCMRMRGVEKQNSLVITSTLLGAFRTRQETRNEFMTLIRQRS